MLRRSRWWAVLFMLAAPLWGACQDEETIDDVSVTLSVDGLGDRELGALVTENSVFLPVSTLMDYLKIKNHVEKEGSLICGSFLQDSFALKGSQHQLWMHKGVVSLDSTAFLMRGGTLYLRADAWAPAFGLHTQFSFRNLQLGLRSDRELPVLLEKKLEAARMRLQQLRGGKVADTSFTPRFSLLQLGALDWLLSLSQRFDGTISGKGTLGIGGTVLGGEATAVFYYQPGKAIWSQQPFLRWRYVQNRSSLLRQCIVGNVSTPTIATLTHPLEGMQITNRSTVRRSSFAYYRYHGTTSPGWKVELYENNVLLDYTQADSAGLFHFDVPLQYGSTTLTLRYFSAWGEEGTEARSFSIPYEALPAGIWEYTLTGGLVQDSTRSRYLRLQENYGLTRHLTLGGGAEYLSSVKVGPMMPFLTGSLQAGGRLLFSAEYVAGVRSRGTMSYRMGKAADLQVEEVLYARHQQAIRNNYLQEHKALLSVPFASHRISGLTRFSYEGITYPEGRSDNFQWLSSTSIRGVMASINHTLMRSVTGRYFGYTNLELSLRTVHAIRLAPQVQYDWNTRQMNMFKVEGDATLRRGSTITMSVEKNLLVRSLTATLGVRLNLTFSQAAVQMQRSSGKLVLTEAASGSFLFPAGKYRAEALGRSSVGKGALLIVPYLDENCNSRRDQGEPAVPGLDVGASSGLLEERTRDTVVRITELEAYSPCLITLGASSLENPAWQLSNKCISVTVKPNQVQVVEVAVQVMGQVSGHIRCSGEKGLKEASGIRINIYDEKGTMIAHTFTEQDGFYTYLGLRPGLYHAAVDVVQLERMHLRSGESRNFEIRVREEGDMAEDVDMELFAK